VLSNRHPPDGGKAQCASTDNLRLFLQRNRPHGFKQFYAMKNPGDLMDNPTASNPPEISAHHATGISKVATHIDGLDDILHGGLPMGRVTLVAGGPGAGKTVLGLEFLYRGALSGDPGIFLTFEEPAENIRRNVRSLGWDLKALEQAGTLVLMSGQPPPESAVSGKFNLQGLLAILGGKAAQMGAKRVVIDALDVLMRIFRDPHREQQEILALHNWLAEQGLTAILTTKNLKPKHGESAYEHLDFLADCVIYLDQRIRDQVNTKRIQIIKYRGSAYGSNEYPFLITDNGMVVNAISDMWLQHDAFSQRIPSGNPFLDEILCGGYWKGTCILISGPSGTGKTSVASTFVQASCAEGRKVLYVNFEESAEGMMASMRSIGVDLRSAVQSACLQIMSTMPESKGIEEHLYDKLTAIRSFQPDHLVVDAISACSRIAGAKAAFDFVMRLTHFCRRRGITVFLINQAAEHPASYAISGIGISSIIDTIITLEYADAGDETRRRLQVRKSRGSSHSNRYHNFLLTDTGIRFDGLQSENARRKNQ
jgi:circadian clock protein KaiC